MAIKDRIPDLTGMEKAWRVEPCLNPPDKTVLVNVKIGHFLSGYL
jgi:hypothetical protein